MKPGADIAKGPPPKPFTVGNPDPPDRAPRELGRLHGVGSRRTKAPVAVSRDQVGARSPADPALRGRFQVTLADGTTVDVRPVFDLLAQYLDDSFDLQTTAEVCNVPPEAVRSLARQIAENKGSTLLAAGMGPNHYFNNDLFGRSQFLVGALTDNVGHVGGNVGSFAGNYRGSLFQAVPPVDPRGSVQHRDGPLEARERQEVLQGRIGPLLELRRAPAAGR